MPTVLRWHGYRFHFFSNEGSEPPHIHIEKDGAEAKFWLEPVSLARNVGFSAREIGVLERKVSDEAASFQTAWNEYFNNHR